MKQEEDCRKQDQVDLSMFKALHAEKGISFDKPVKGDGDEQAVKRYKVSKEALFSAAASEYQSKAKDLITDAAAVLASFKLHYGTGFESCGPLLKVAAEGQLILCVGLFFYNL